MVQLNVVKWDFSSFHKIIVTQGFNSHLTSPDSTELVVRLYRASDSLSKISPSRASEYLVMKSQRSNIGYIESSLVPSQQFYSQRKSINHLVENSAISASVPLATFEADFLSLTQQGVFMWAADVLHYPFWQTYLWWLIFKLFWNLSDNACKHFTKLC